MAATAAPRLFLAAAVVLATASALSLPVPDKPYTEFIAHRFTNSRTRAVAGWGTLPMESINQVWCMCTVRGRGGFQCREGGCV